MLGLQVCTTPGNIFIFLTWDTHVEQAGLKLLGSSTPMDSASQVAGTIGTYQYGWLVYFSIFLLYIYQRKERI
jgi:hypothetical protein